MRVSESIFTDPSKFGDRPGSRFQSKRRPIKRARSSSTSIPLSADHRVKENRTATQLQWSRKASPRHKPWRSSGGSIDRSFGPQSNQIARQLALARNKPGEEEAPYISEPSTTSSSDRPPNKKPCRKQRSIRALSSASGPPTRIGRRQSSSIEADPLCSRVPSDLSIFASNNIVAKKRRMAPDRNRNHSRSPHAVREATPELYSRNQSMNAQAQKRVSNSRVSLPHSRSSYGLDIIQEIGAVEVLDQDDRPTFIIDLQNHANFEPGPLHILFSNTVLRASGETLDLVTGRGLQGSYNLSSTSMFNEFKSWTISYVKNHESLDVSLPSFRYLGATWSCNTLRKRLRIIRGVFPSSSTHLPKSSPSSDVSSVRYDSRVRTPGSAINGGSMIIDEEDEDYFGNLNLAQNTKSRATGDRGITSRDSSRTSSVISGERRPRFADQDSSRTLPLRQATREKDFLQTKNEAITHNASAEHNESLEADPNQAFFDWTRLPVTPAMPRHIQFVRSIDWASTSLGPMEYWDADLRSMCNLVMASPHPAAMYWGDDLVAIYNEPYILLAGQKHPQLMGQRYRDAWSEIWDAVEGVFADAKNSGQSTMKDDDCLFIDRAETDGFLEETYFSWSIIPLIGADGSIVGYYNPAFEKTRRKIAERRMLTLRELGEKTSTAGDLQTFWNQVLEALALNPYDAPFVLVYSAFNHSETSETSSTSVSSVAQEVCSLRGALGVPESHPQIPQIVDVGLGNTFLAKAFKDCSELDAPAFLRVDEGTLDADLVDGIGVRGYPDQCKAAVCFPVHATSGDKILGYVLMGLNPRRPYDDDYSLFVQILSRQLATTMASVMLFVEEVSRGKRAARRAAADKVQLSAQLADQTQQARESEAKFARMAEVAPVGIFIADTRGLLIYCNDTWHNITKVPKGAGGLSHWIHAVKAEDRELAESSWADLVHEKVPFKEVELRFNTAWKDPNGNMSDTWVLMSAYPEKDEDGNLKIIFGSLTNISQQKWAELIEKRHAEEARESKRQQENFIDITSHEMRNPLSAILQSADDIATSLTTFSNENSALPTPISEMFENSIDCAQTITLCAQHQKRIVDDILTLSKLDSALLLVTPCDVSPVGVVHRALKMFESEFQTAGIKLEFKVDQSLTDLHVTSVKLDPSRMLQVMINLITNAIKFTSPQEKKVITISIGASLERPPKDRPNYVSYFPTRAKRQDLTEGEEWGTGEKLYMHFAVQDTGRGLSEDETKLLFMRFSQASPRTHVQYGGSGLGLFISRELVELQGGEIGVRSKSGEGSIFAFYVTTRRSSNPPEQMDYTSPPAILEAQQRELRTSRPKHSSAVTPSLARAPPAPEGTEESRLSILIVEDNLVNQKVLQKQLRNKGFDVLIANHGEECLEILRKTSYARRLAARASGQRTTTRSPYPGHQLGDDQAIPQFDLILMDLEMPIMDGLTCTREIRKLEKSGEIIRHVPIIAVTANARSEQVQGAKDRGVDDVVSKPFQIRDLIPRVEELVRRFLPPEAP